MGEQAYPTVRGVSRDLAHERCAIVHFDRRLTDAELRELHLFVREFFEEANEFAAREARGGE